jgi:two-component system sensor histidine kinase PilS (NtrC family)
MTQSGDHRHGGDEHRDDGLAAVPHAVDDTPSMTDGLASESGSIALPGASALRRVNFFMAFRLAVLLGLTVLAAAAAWLDDGPIDARWIWFTGIALAIAFAQTATFLVATRRARDVRRIGWAQTIIDLGFAAVFVQATGGTQSGFAFLYLIAILGAATMGSRQQTWLATAASAALYGGEAILEGLGFVLPQIEGVVVTRDPAEVVRDASRVLFAIGGVGALSAYLTQQATTSATQVGSLRALNENIVRSMTTGLITTDPRGKILFLNPMAREILGSTGELLGADIDALIPDTRQRLDPSDPSPQRWERELRRPDGRTLHIGGSHAPLVDADGRPIGFLVNFQDLTQLRELSRRVRASERMAAVGQLAATVAHEIRNPLAAIAGSAALLDNSSLPSDDARLLAIIRRESRRLETTVTDLLAFTRARPPDFGDVDLGRRALDVAEAFRADPANAAVLVELDVQPGVIIRADSDQLAQVLWNLLRNAAEAQEGRGRIDVAVFRGAGRGCLRVRDHGPGIPEDRIDRIFEPFFTMKKGGTGFGLAIVHRVVETHEAEMHVDSPPDGGASFTLRFELRR